MLELKEIRIHCKSLIFTSRLKFAAACFGLEKPYTKNSLTVISRVDVARMLEQFAHSGARVRTFQQVRR
jgi:hypothetical protein